MSVYAEIQASKIVNIVECDPTFATEFGLVPLPAGAGIGWTTTDGTTWTAPPIPITAQNRAALNQKAAGALATNTTYLAIASPTSAQAITQVAVLTRECSALIRLLLGLLDSTQGT